MNEKMIMTPFFKKKLLFFITRKVEIGCKYERERERERETDRLGHRLMEDCYIDHIQSPTQCFYFSAGGHGPPNG